MTKYIISLIMMTMSFCSFASSNVTFPVHHAEMAPDQEFSIPLYGPGLLKGEAPYTLTCQLNNPSNERVAVSINYWIGGLGLPGDKAYLNGKEISNIVNKLEPGVNKFVITNLVLHPDLYLNQDFSIWFKNFDNDHSIFVEACNAVM